MSLKKSDISKVISSDCTDIAWIFPIRNLSKHDAQVVKNIRLLRSLILRQGMQGKQRTHICIPKNDPIEDKNLFLEMIRTLDIYQQNIHIFDEEG